jgi:hypothetical protein
MFTPTVGGHERAYPFSLPVAGGGIESPALYASAVISVCEP